MATQAGLFDHGPRPARDTVTAFFAGDTTVARRYYVRCHDCLSVMVMASPQAPGRSMRFECGACGGGLTLMGEVTRDGKRWARREVVSVCDARCTNAHGPSCDCTCGGRNHGSHLVVEVVRAEGRLPRMTPVKVEQARALGEAYRAARDECRDAWGARYWKAVESMRQGWVPPATFSVALAGRRVEAMRRHLEQGKTQGRTAALRDLAARIREGKV